MPIEAFSSLSRCDKLENWSSFVFLFISPIETYSFFCTKKDKLAVIFTKATTALTLNFDFSAAQLHFSLPFFLGGGGESNLP